jgi:hypothetical protein
LILSNEKQIGLKASAINVPRVLGLFVKQFFV